MIRQSPSTVPAAKNGSSMLRIALLKILIMNAAASDCCKFLVQGPLERGCKSEQNSSDRGWGPLVCLRERGNEADNRAMKSRDVLHWTGDRF